ASPSNASRKSFSRARCVSPVGVHVMIFGPAKAKPLCGLGGHIALKAAISLVLFAAVSFGTLAAHAQDINKAVGEDLLARGLELLDAEWRYDQLAKNGRISAAALRQNYLKHVGTLAADTLVQVRGICAAHRMPYVKATVESKGATLPDVHAYCRAAIET